VFQSRDLFKGGAQAGKPRPSAFRPELFQGNWELSVCRNTGVAEERIWEIGRTCRADKPAIARADVGMSAVHDTDLMARAAPGTYPEHAVVLGWPLAVEKNAHMMQMVALAAAADARMAPASRLSAAGGIGG
jgi:hypothetical protein